MTSQKTNTNAKIRKEKLWTNCNEFPLFLWYSSCRQNRPHTNCNMGVILELTWMFKWLIYVWCFKSKWCAGPTGPKAQQRGFSILLLAVLILIIVPLKSIPVRSSFHCESYFPPQLETASRRTIIRTGIVSKISMAQFMNTPHTHTFILKNQTFNFCLWATVEN